MVKKCFALLIPLFLLCGGVSFADLVALGGEIDYTLPVCLLPPPYFDFMTREAAAGRLTIRKGKLGSKRGQRQRLGLSGEISQITINTEIMSSCEADILQTIVHELAHAGAAGTGNDDWGYDKQKELNAFKREAEYWKSVDDKPPRDHPAGKSCWGVYDIVFNADGTQRSHYEIKKKLMQKFGYWADKM